MPQANYSLGLVQLGRESVAGTAVAATEIWRGLAAYPDDDRTRTAREEEVGLLVPAEDTYDTQYGAIIQLPATEASYEQLPHIFEAGILTATPTGTAPNYVREYSFALGTTFNTIRPYTLRCGNSIATGDFQVVPYCFVSEFELSGQSGEAWMIASTWNGQRLTSGTPTGALSLLSVTPMIFANTLLYLDDTGGTIGTTQAEGVLRAFSMRVQTGVKYVVPGDGQLYYINHWFDRPAIEISLTLALENDDNIVAAERADFAANVIRLLRLQTPGASNRSFTADMAVRWDKVNPYEKLDDGATGVKFDGHAVYSPTDALYAEFSVTNSRATL
jgi:hypothetical protein